MILGPTGGAAGPAYRRPLPPVLPPRGLHPSAQALPPLELTVPEMRYNPITGEWVIIAPERARRPGVHLRGETGEAPSP
jgi:hypothetical protein